MPIENLFLNVASSIETDGDITRTSRFMDVAKPGGLVTLVMGPGLSPACLGESLGVSLLTGCFYNFFYNHSGFCYLVPNTVLVLRHKTLIMSCTVSWWHWWVPSIWQWWGAFPVKDPTGHVDSVTSPQPCGHTAPMGEGEMDVHGCLPTQFYLSEQCGCRATPGTGQKSRSRP